MANIALPHTGKILYPIKDSSALLEGKSDGFIYDNQTDRLFLRQIDLVFPSLNHSEAEEVIEALTLGFSAGNRLTYGEAFFLPAASFLEEKWFVDYVELTLHLKEVR